MKHMLGLAVVALFLSSCGAYGEKGFTGKDPLTADRFIEDVDEICTDANDDLGDEIGTLLSGTTLDEDDLEKALKDWRQSFRDLTRELPDNYGPEELELLRDAHVDALDAAEEAVDEALDLVPDAGATTKFNAARTGLATVQTQLRTAGFEVCGLPHPTDGPAPSSPPSSATTIPVATTIPGAATTPTPTPSAAPTPTP